MLRPLTVGTAAVLLVAGGMGATQTSGNTTLPDVSERAASVRCDNIAWPGYCIPRELEQSEWDDVDGAMNALNEIGGVCSDLADIIEGADIYAYDDEVFADPPNNTLRIDGQAFCENCNGSPEYAGRIHFWSGGDHLTSLIHEAIHYELNTWDHSSAFEDIEYTCVVYTTPLPTGNTPIAHLRTRSALPAEASAWHRRQLEFVGSAGVTTRGLEP